ncbi:uncharacterized protein LOC131665669 [Phymastichus coffea]|uniref:uncharacterized protein LOC131665669 n=1 Tax=Phymastichus coffea TaxID=108790 RepID=UPI00273C23A2|nr:uncharacterized protein LOC131665669 [Phymastichus coffea]
MKLFLIFLIICLLGCHKTCSQKQNLQYSIAKLIITECLREYNGRSDQMDKTKVTDHGKLSTNDASCLYACGFRKWSEEKGLTLYNGFLKMIDEVYESGFRVTKFTRTDITSKVKRCSIKENDDCEFSKCVGIFEPPFIDIYLYRKT